MGIQADGLDRTGRDRDGQGHGEIGVRCQGREKLVSLAEREK